MTNGSTERSGLAGTNGRPLTKLAGDIARDARFLAEQELLLVKAEAKQTAAGVGRGLAILLAGTSILTAGLVCLLGAGIAALSGYLPLWGAALVVGLAALLVAAGIIKWGISQFTSGLLADSQVLDQLNSAPEESREASQ